MPAAPAPLLVDPVFNGAADPVPVWNRQEKAWWILYTNRRATLELPGFAWVHGTDIGIGSSTSGGAKWKYRGVCKFEAFEPGHNTYWAPEILWHDGLYHAYVSYITGIPQDWDDSRHIVHYTSENLWDWKYQSHLKLSSDRVIDACVFLMPNGTWRMWYKDEGNHSHTWCADSDDLYKWRTVGPVITDVGHEGPNVFRWRDHYWMITDPWKGLGVYRSPDLIKWTRQADILAGVGQRNGDGFRASHADVLVQGDEAYVFYFVHAGGIDPNGGRERVTPYAQRQTVLQVARLDLKDGQLICDRDAAYDFKLADEIGG